MSIQFKCPNGHVLKVKDKYAGQTGLCPRCQVRVLVPNPQPASLSEDAIVDLLGPPSAEDEDSLPVHQDPVQTGSGASSSGSSLLGAAMNARGTKICPKCRAEVRACYDLCPYCHTYFTDMQEIARRLKTDRP